MTKHHYTDVLEYWFGQQSSDEDVIKEKSSLWWSKDENLDREIRDRFGELHDKACTGMLDSWKKQPKSYLALIVLTDQFSRNMYRGTPKAFAQDPLALSLTVDGIELGMTKQLRWIEKVFFCMPLEHSESLAMQERSVKMFRELAGDVPESSKNAFSENIDFAVKHWEIINQFGRFPHRNAILNRESTPEEVNFLKQSGSSF